MRTSRVFSRACELAIAMGAIGINKLPGCYEHQVDEHWWFAINAHPESNDCSKSKGVPPMTIYLEFNGWPAGFVNSGGGRMVGDQKREDSLIIALEAAIIAAGGTFSGEAFQA
jgi:hypothetical protein